MNLINQKGESGKRYAIGRKEKARECERERREKRGRKKRRRSEGSG